MLGQENRLKLQVVAIQLATCLGDEIKVHIGLASLTHSSKLSYTLCSENKCCSQSPTIIYILVRSLKCEYLHGGLPLPHVHPRKFKQTALLHATIYTVKMQRLF